MPTKRRLTAVGASLIGRLDRAGVVALLARVIDRAAIVRVLVRVTGDKQIAGAIALLPGPMVARIVEILDTGEPPPRDRELAIGHALIAHANPAVRAWALEVTAISEPSVLVSAPPPRTRKELDPALRHTIATCNHKDLPTALAPAFEAPVIGLAAALSSRKANPSVHACAALLGCADPIVDVARELDRFSADDERFEAELDNAACKWLRIGDLPPLANAWLLPLGGAHVRARRRGSTRPAARSRALREIDALPGAARRARRCGAASPRS